MKKIIFVFHIKVALYPNRFKSIHIALKSLGEPTDCKCILLINVIVHFEHSIIRRD